MHADGCQQETSDSTRADSPGCAAVSCRQVVPSQAAAVAGDEPKPWPPTATQLPAVRQDRSLRSGITAPVASCRQELPSHPMVMAQSQGPSAPTATQLDALGQEMTNRPALLPGLGGFVGRQAAPFQARALLSATVPAWLLVDPTAMQLLAVGQETWASVQFEPQPSPAVLSRRQAWPFHSSIRLNTPKFPPTAMQNEALAHETADMPRPPGGVFSTRQVRPSHASASACSALLRPMAMQNEALVQDTANSPPPASALRSTRQLLPFHSCARARPTPAGKAVVTVALRKLPTAMQNEALTHETPPRSSLAGGREPLNAGVGAGSAPEPDVTSLAEP